MKLGDGACLLGFIIWACIKLDAPWMIAVFLGGAVVLNLVDDLLKKRKA